MANDTAFRAGRFLQGQVTQDFAGCGPGNRPTYPNGDCTFFGCQPSVQNPCITRTEMPDCRAGGFVGAAGPGAAVTGTIECNPSAIDACPSMRGCQSQPPTALCTQTPELCPTFCGPACQTPQPNCTSINCTQAGPQCPPQTIPPQCPGETNVILDCTFGCTQFGPACPPTPLPQCGNVTLDAGCQTVNVQPQAVGAAGQAAITRQTMLVWQCGGPTPATRCFICPPMTFDFNCNIQQAAAAPVAARATAATVCTQSGPQCPSVIDACPTRLCTPATVCTQFGEQCRSAVDACPTRLCGGGGAVGAAAAPGAWPTPQTRCFICPPRTLDYNCNVQQAGGGQFAARATAATVCTQSGPQCPSVIDACPTRLCTPATVCTQFGEQCRSAVDACPTRLCGGGGGAVGAAAAPGAWPTPQTRCFVCDPAFAAGGGGQFAARATAATVCTQSGPQCPSVIDACPTRMCTPATVCTQFGEQCRSAVDACPTRLCAGGGGGAVGAAAAPGAWPTPQTRCFVC